jgi:hypothetical protein
VQRQDNYRLVTFTFGSKLHGQLDPKLRMSVHRDWIESPRRSSWFLSVLDAEVDDAREGSYCWCSETLALLGH